MHPRPWRRFQTPASSRHARRAARRSGADRRCRARRRPRACGAQRVVHRDNVQAALQADIDAARNPSPAARGARPQARRAASAADTAPSYEIGASRQRRCRSPFPASTRSRRTRRRSRTWRPSSFAVRSPSESRSCWPGLANRWRRPRSRSSPNSILGMHGLALSRVGKPIAAGADFYWSMGRSGEAGVVHASERPVPRRAKRSPPRQSAHRGRRYLPVPTIALKRRTRLTALAGASRVDRTRTQPITVRSTRVEDRVGEAWCAAEVFARVVRDRRGSFDRASRMARLCRRSRGWRGCDRDRR
jgi:hypothetical protein